MHLVQNKVVLVVVPLIGYAQDVYELQAVIVHYGRTCLDGHYVAYLNFGLEKHWIRCNDDVVRWNLNL